MRFRACAILVLAATLGVVPAPGVLAVDESALIEQPPLKSVEEESGPLERAFQEPPPPEPVLFPGIKRSLENLPAFFRDTELGVDFRTYYFRRRFTDDRDAEALAMGGTLRYRSGWLLDRLQIGAALFTSQKLYGPVGRDGTGLLRPGQKSYTVAGEAFVRFREQDNELTLYRHRIDLPYLNGNDSRMTPNTFEGATLIGRHSPISYAVGHLTQFKPRNEDEFVSFSQAAGARGGSNRGLSFAGVQIKPTESLSLGAINHFVNDTLNTAYTEIDWFHGSPDGWGLRLGAQFTHQRSVGDDRLTGDSFETWVVGGKVAASFRDAVLSVAMSITHDDERIRNPWGSYPGYLAMMQRNFNDADEKAWSVGASWYFGLVGVPDLSIALRYTEGYDGRDIQADRNLGDHREFNSTLDYRLSRGLLRGLWLRARFAWGHLDNVQRDSLETRIILRYEFQAL